jgi:hypothetical protein
MLPVLAQEQRRTVIFGDIGRLLIAPAAGTAILRRPATNRRN